MWLEIIIEGLPGSDSIFWNVFSFSGENVGPNCFFFINVVHCVLMKAKVPIFWTEKYVDELNASYQICTVWNVTPQWIFSVKKGLVVTIFVSFQIRLRFIPWDQWFSSKCWKSRAAVILLKHKVVYYDVSWLKS